MDETFAFFALHCVPAIWTQHFTSDQLNLRQFWIYGLGLSHVFPLDLVTATWPGGTGVLGRNVPLPKSTSHATASANLCAEERKCDSPWCMNLTQILSGISGVPLSHQEDSVSQCRMASRPIVCPGSFEVFVSV